MPVEIIAGFEEKFGCMILEAYGLSETSPVASFNHPGRRAARLDRHAILGDRDACRRHRWRRAGVGKSARSPSAGTKRHEPATGQARGDGERRSRDGWFRTGDWPGWTTMATSSSSPQEGPINPGRVSTCIRARFLRGPARAPCRPLRSRSSESRTRDWAEEIGAAVPAQAGRGREQPQNCARSTVERVAAYKYPRHVWLVASCPRDRPARF